MPRAFTAGAGATLVVRDLHIRFLHEARVGAGLRMEGAVLDMGETDARILMILFHTSGQPAAALTYRVEHVTPVELRPFPWPKSARHLAEGLMGTAPDYALPRGLTGDLPAEPATVALADSLGFGIGVLGALTPLDTDVFGRMTPEHLLERISHSMPHYVDRRSLPVEDHMPELVGRLGGATVEFQAAFRRWPRAGERLVLRSGMTRLSGKSAVLAQWLLDPATGASWAEARMVIVNLDLQARKAVELTPPLVEIMARLLTPAPGY